MTIAFIVAIALTSVCIVQEKPKSPLCSIVPDFWIATVGGAGR